ncbi:paraquat-inducible protein A [Rhodobacteraceae bacterium N5(2021)]|uniref:Paraquat-inducible protein A n=1 Tax=Gymnodinialimonas phycosphaerae TaxID=2841589 RepID=A0A975YEV9_9RHOB|nr:paraquat-inducible protein A [Gymnodinialimonas phycosphaerae]MBY4894020.1 paraquat-inducible protein A [Gymnodinialimonas phycosphaerae]
MQRVITARETGRVVCRSCSLVAPAKQMRCARCNEWLQSRDALSQQKVWAWLIVGLIAYIPANLYAMLRTTQSFRTTESTIVGGVVDLVHHGAYAVAIIVFVASIVIPVGKFIVIAYLAILTTRRHRTDPHRLLLLHEVVEFIGRWSMIDVFVVAILTALVQFDVLATINPGIAAVCFALSVVFTMLAAQSFDSRQIWDRLEGKSNHE